MEEPQFNSSTECPVFQSLSSFLAKVSCNFNTLWFIDQFIWQTYTEFGAYKVALVVKNLSARARDLRDMKKKKRHEFGRWVGNILWRRK